MWTNRSIANLIVQPNLALYFEEWRLPGTHRVGFECGACAFASGRECHSTRRVSGDGGGGGEGRYNRNLNVHEARGIKTFCVVSEGVGFLSVARERAEICIPDDGAVDRVKIGENPKPGIGVARTTGRWHKRGSGCAA